MTRSRSRALALGAVLLLTMGSGRARADLISQWLFDETGGSVAHDSVGGVDGTLFGGAAFAPGAGPGTGIYSGAISLDGASNTYVNMGNAYNFTSGDFSIIAWVKTSTTPGEFVVSRHHSGSGNGYFIAVGSAGDGVATMGSHFYTSGNGVASPMEVDDSQWHQLVAVYTAGVGASYYVDGTFQASAAVNPIQANDAPFMIGGVDSFGTLVGAYTGLISDVSVYDNALSASDVHTLYEQVVGGSAVPEPSSMVLAGLGISGALSYAGFRKTRSRSPA